MKDAKAVKAVKDAKAVKVAVIGGKLQGTEAAAKATVRYKAKRRLSRSMPPRSMKARRTRSDSARW